MGMKLMYISSSFPMKCRRQTNHTSITALLKRSIGCMPGSQTKLRYIEKCTIITVLIFVQVLPMVALFIVAFAMSFAVLMSHDQGFADIPNSLLTTFVMMTGEVDFRDTFLGYAASAGFHFLQRLLLVVFLILVTIGITNLLTGLAVGDTAEIMERSREENLLRKVRKKQSKIPKMS